MIGYIQGLDSVSFTVVVPFTETRLIERQNITECEVILHDGRSLSPLQRNKIFALINDITAFVSGLDSKKMAFDETLCSMQLNYLISISPETVRYQLTQNYCRLSGIDLFSLAQTLPQVIRAALCGADIQANKPLDDIEVSVDFGEYANPSFEAQVETIGKAFTQGVMSTEAVVEQLWGDSKDSKWKEEEVARLKEAQGMLPAEEPFAGADATPPEGPPGDEV